LFSTDTLPRILRILDSLPSHNARSITLSRLLSIDEVSLSKPGGETFLTERSSPPPLDELLSNLAGEKEEDRAAWNGDGWWLGRDGSKEGRVWIGEEERRMMRLWAGVICQAIDGNEVDAGWGQGGLGWEV